MQRTYKDIYNKHHGIAGLIDSGKMPIKYTISSNNNFDNSNSSNNRTQKNRPQKYNFAHINLNYLFNSDLEQPIVEFMGIKLYLDDLIIIGLLFFLYKEDVHDEILFGILLLLLLS